MKCYVILLFIFCISLNGSSQVGIGTDIPKATLDIKANNLVTPSNNTGLLIPRVRNFPTIDPTNEQDAMLLFITGEGLDPRGFYFWDRILNDWKTFIPTGSGGNTLDGAYNQGGLGAGKTINAINGTVEIVGNSGFEVRLDNTESAMAGPGEKMFFNPSNGAFRAGAVGSGGLFNSSAWDIGNQGSNSFAVNIGTIASGSNSFAAGILSEALGYASIAMGEGALANSSEMAVGSYNAVAANRKFVVGNGFGDENRSSAFEVFSSGIVRISDAYNLPVIDGAANQVLSTNGNGTVTWVNNGGSDDQKIDNLILDGSILKISLEDDGQASQTLDLAPLQDGTGTDDQNISGSQLVGTELTIGIENGNSETIDLISLVPTKAKARIIMSAAQAMTGGGVTKVAFDTPDFDIGGNFDTTTDEYEIPMDGIYRITAQYTTDATTSSQAYEIRIRVNGQQERRVGHNHLGSGLVVRQVQSMMQLQQGDKVDIAILRPSATNIQANARVSYFEIEQL